MTTSTSNADSRECTDAAPEARQQEVIRARLLLKASGIVLLCVSIGWVLPGIVSIASLMMFILTPRSESVPVMDVGEPGEPLADLLQSVLLLGFFVATHCLGWHLVFSRHGLVERLVRRLCS